MPVRVLIVDDSAFIRKLLQARLAKEDDIEVVGCACDAQEARSLMKVLDPDVVTLDIEMPGMDGLSFLQKIMELRPTPVIIVSGSTQAGNKTTALALQLGAVSCYTKGDRNGSMQIDDTGRLASLVRDAAQAKFRLRKPKAQLVKEAVISQLKPCTSLIAIGASTGGVEALRTLLSAFPTDCPPTVIVQHINARFAPAVAQSLDSACEASVALAQTDDFLKRGHIYLAPGGDHHLRVAKSKDAGLRTILRKGDPVSGHRPSVDALFDSVASVVGDEALGILLTGMGKDGAKGLLAMSQQGAWTIAQDEASCTVFGMPRAAVEIGAAREVLSLQKIAGQVCRASGVRA